MTFDPRQKRLCALLLLSLWLALAGTPALGADNQVEAARYYEDALSRYEKKDVPGAIIQLKNALQRDSRMLSAHVLLARAYLENGDPAAAESALTNAARMGVARSEIAEMQAQALFYQGKFQDLLEKLPTAGLPAQVQQTIQLLRVYAALELGDPVAAETALKSAQSLGQTTAGVLVAQGMLNLKRGQTAQARQAAEQALRLNPREGRAWNLLASIDHMNGIPQRALDHYAKALALAPGLRDARVARIGLLLDIDKFDAAGKEIQQALKQQGDDPRLTYLHALYLEQKGDARGARAALLETAKLIDALPPGAIARRGQLLMLGALAHHGLNAPEKAMSYLGGYIKLYPDHAGARKLLGAIYLRQGNTDAAVRVLEKAHQAMPGDAKVVTLLAAAYMAKQQPARAAALLERAGAAAQQEPEVAAALGFSLLGAGRGDEGLEHLQRAFSGKSGDPKIGSALVMLHIQRGRPREAVRVAETLTRKYPRNAVGHNLLGVAHAAAGDRTAARTAYRQALRLEPELAAARLNLGKLETLEGRYDEARRQFQRILEKDGRNVPAQYELARSEEAAGRTGEAIRWLELIRSRNGSDVQAAVRLVDLYLQQEQTDKALEAAQQASGVSPDDFRVLSALGRAQAAAGQADRAKVAFLHMAREAGSDIGKLAEAARLQLALGDLDGAYFSLNQAFTADPNAPQAHIQMASLELRRGQRDRAFERMRRLAAAQPRSGPIQRALGDVALAAGDAAQAAQSYRTALALEPSPEHALLLARALQAKGDVNGAIALLKDWQPRQPGEVRIGLALAESYLRLGQFAQARTAYEKYLQRHGDHPQALNNLANILMRQGDAKALDYAERAYRLAPEDYGINDTLGWLLLQGGQIDRALRHLREARLRAPDNREVRYHLAAALHRAGRDREALEELDHALRGGVSFTGIEGARQLQGQLSGRGG